MPEHPADHDPTIRTARASESDAIVAFWNTTAEPAVSDDGIGIVHLLERDPDALLVAERNGAIVGTIVAGWDGWRGNMYRLAVDPAHRREGIAMALVRAAEERLRALGTQRVTALVVSAHDEATGFWRAAGYEHDLRMARYVKMIRREAE